jgi:hypothetical protein
MSELTRRPDPNRIDCWLIYYGDVRVGLIARSASTPEAMTQWNWSCEFRPIPGDQYGGTAETFAKARAAFKAAWQDYLAQLTKGDFQTGRDQQAWTVEKYLHIDRGERRDSRR